MSVVSDVFVDACACGDIAGVVELLKDSKTTKDMINKLDKDGRSALHYACLNDDLPLAKILLADERVDVELRTPRGDTIVHMVSLYAALQVLGYLFTDERAFKLLNAKNNWGETPLHLCAGSGDKGAGRAAAMLLDAGASMLETDQWMRGPMDVAHDNGENPLVSVFEAYLEKAPAGMREKVEAVSAKAEQWKKDSAPKPDKAKVNIFAGGLGGALKGLKKVEIAEKQIFAKTEGKVSDKKGAQDARSMGKVLSKLIDFPGDYEEISKHLADSKVDPGGKDAFGLTALMKFASWNKVELIDMLLPVLSADDINAQDPEGKTALHWACEMASVGSVNRLVAHPEIIKDLVDNKGRTPEGILDTGSGTVIDRLRAALQGKGEA